MNECYSGTGPFIANKVTIVCQEASLAIAGGSADKLFKRQIVLMLWLGLEPNDWPNIFTAADCCPGTDT